MGEILVLVVKMGGATDPFLVKHPADKVVAARPGKPMERRVFRACRP
jgi:hypothetical protein